MEEKICHAWFSQKQYKIINRNLFYVTIDFNCVQVTEISEEGTDSYFDDAVYLGMVYDHGIYKNCSDEEKYALIEKKKHLYNK